MEKVRILSVEHTERVSLLTARFHVRNIETNLRASFTTIFHSQPDYHAGRLVETLILRQDHNHRVKHATMHSYHNSLEKYGHVRLPLAAPLRDIENFEWYLFTEFHRVPDGYDPACFTIIAEGLLTKDRETIALLKLQV